MSRNIWVTSDTHFNHTNIIQYCGRPYANAELMNEMLIENWNSVVKDGDIVYHLGDVYMGPGFTKEDTHRTLSKLNGRKRLVLGNHDNGKDELLHLHFQKIGIWRNFSEFGLLMTHVPVHESSLFRGASRRDEEHQKLRNVHGHIHDLPAPSSDHLCVCVEQTDYKPINIESIRKW